MNRKILVLHVCHQFGGAEKSLLELLGHLTERNRYLLVLNPRERLSREARSAGFEVIEEEILYFRKKEFLRNPVRWLIKWHTACSRIRTLCRINGIGTIYCHTHRSLIYTIKVNRRRCRIVSACRDNLKTILEKWIIRILSDRVISISRYLSRQIGSSDKVKTLYTPVAIPKPAIEFAPSPPGTSGRDTLRILCIGHIQEWKNQLRLVGTAKEMIRSYSVPFHFYCIGSVTDRRYYDRICSEIKTLGLESHFTYYGFAENPGDYISEADIVIHPALCEPFGRAVVESMGAGKPVVVHREGGPAELVVDGFNGLLADMTDSVSVSRAVISLSDPLVRRRIGSNASARIATDFNPLLLADSFAGEIGRCSSAVNTTR